jgi:hypothetical protein
MIQIKVEVTDGASPMLKRAIAALRGSQSAQLNEQGGREAVNAAVTYHRNFDKSGGWRGKRYLGSASDGSSYGSEVSEAWSFQSSDERGATIANNARFLKFKSTGGTVKPKRTKYLTIPMIAEARGRSAANYEVFAQKNLFTIKGKRALFETKDDGGLRAVYALVKSVTHQPWPGALPPNDLIADAFMNRYRRGLLEILQS